MIHASLRRRSYMQEVQAGFSLERLATGANASPGPVAARFFITSPLLLSTVKEPGRSLTEQG